MQFENKERCIIISGSPEFQDVEMMDTDYVIACDDGLSHCLNHAIKPSLVVGDFDSYQGVVPDDIEQVRVKAEKDDTDTMLASKIALEKGYKHIILLGALGGRLDHTIANLSTAAFIAEQQGICELIGENECIYMVRNSVVKIERNGFRYISVFSYSESVIVTYEGLKYPLQKKTLCNEFPLGVSNEFCEDLAVIKAESGTACIVCTKKGR